VPKQNSAKNTGHFGGMLTRCLFVKAW